MINPVPYIRKAFYDLLNGAITYDSVTVPVSEGEGVAAKYQIIIAETTCLDAGTKHSFAFDCTQLIEVISELTNSSATKHVDIIGGEVANLVQPAPQEKGIEEDQFQFIGLRLGDQRYVREKGANSSRIIRLLLRYQFIINQINL